MKKDMGPEVGMSNPEVETSNTFICQTKYPFKCPICTRVPHEFSSNDALQRHIQDFHQVFSNTTQELSKLTTIGILEKRFFNAKNKTYDCAWCNKKFKHLKVLQQHFKASHSDLHIFF